ncbi:MAG: HAD-IA family hydrolase [Silicimonas sp.]|jgi:phosphoglycolate phosphatase|nr:HAD-IA family hydrolase [Silicimonas sp.]
MKTVICDLDGTLADTSGDLIAAANACFVSEGYSPVLDDQKDMLTAFHGGRAMLRLGYSRLGIDDQARIDAAYPDLLAYYGDHIDVKTKLYPGVTEALGALLDDGYRLGVCTNKPAALAETLLERLGIRPLFTSMIGADTLPVRKPDPEPYFASVREAGGDPAASVLIGDTETDVKTARAAGVPVALVEFGPEGAKVARLNPDALLPAYSQLGRVVRALIG